MALSIEDTARAAELARRVGTRPEPEMRRIALAGFLARVPPARAAAWMADVVRRGREGGAPFDVTLAAFVALLGNPEPLGYEALADIYRAAREAALEDLAALFFSAGGAGEETLRAHVLEAPDGRPLTLGERKSLARRSTRDQLARLLRDPDPAVLRQLLKNPKLTEPDVVMLAARRPTSGEHQQAIFEAARFSSRYPVRRALALNPYTPADLASRLCALLRRRDLAVVAGEPTLPQQVRDAARRLLDARRARDRDG